MNAVLSQRCELGMNRKKVGVDRLMFDASHFFFLQIHAAVAASQVDPGYLPHEALDRGSVKDVSWCTTTYY